MAEVWLRAQEDTWRYTEVSVDLASETVSQLTERWAKAEAVPARPSRIFLYRVPCVGAVPTSEEEASARAHRSLDPPLSLAAAGVTAGSFLLAVFERTGAEPAAKRRRVVESVSDGFARSLAGNSPGNLASAADVRHLLAQQLVTPILVDESHAALLAAAPGRLQVEVRPPDRAMPELEALAESAFCYNVSSGSEEVWASLADALTGRAWRLLSFLSAFSFHDDRNSVDTSGATQKRLRPDYCGRSNHALIVKAEHKKLPAELQLALEELKSKMSTWNPLTMRGMPFLPCYAVGGELLQFAILYTNAGGGIHLETVSDPLNMSVPHDRLRILSASLQFFRVFVWLRARMPPSVIPLYVEQRRDDGGSVTVYDDHVVKHTRRLGAPGVYGLLAAGTIPCAVRVTSCREPCDATPFARLEMTPVGLQVLPGNEAELVVAVKCVLRALSALHQHGYVHRDVRWPNVLITAGALWMLIDFELAAEEGASLPNRAIDVDLVAPEARPLGAQYTAADDIWQVGTLVESAGLEVSPGARAFACALCATRAERPNAGEALMLPWLTETRNDSSA